MPRHEQRFALLLCATLALATLPACGPDTSGEGAATDEAAASVSLHRTGLDGGLFYSCDASGPGTAVFTPDGASGYAVTWSNVSYLLCGKGWSQGKARTITWTGAYENSGGGTYGIYGWTVSPVIEYYVVEKFGATGSPAGGTVMGSYATDGSTYTVYRRMRVNQPCVVGPACTFYQYVAVRQAPRTSGTITLQNHVDAWAKLGLRMGTYSYQLLATEAWNGSGSARATIVSATTPGIVAP